MPCYHPIAAVQPGPGAPLQLYGPSATHGHLRPLNGRIEIPCNKCTGCYRRNSLEWAVRCMHEKQMHLYNSYITLTYDDKYLPEHYSLQHRDFVLMMKSLRHQVARQNQNLLLSPPPLRGARAGGESALQRLLSNYLQDNINDATGAPQKAVAHLLPPEIRFYMAGEYGEKHGRPHYHALLFGVDFADKSYYGKTDAGEKIYRSETLEKIWKKGYSSIGQVTFNSAAYISRYIMKKRHDENKTDYEILDLETGEIYKKKKEYNCMSRNGGIGKNWLEEYTPDVYTRDKVITKSGRELRPPRYYDKLYKRMDRAHLEHLKHVRELESLAQREHHTPARLAAQETVANAAARLQTRNFGGHSG